MIFNQILGWIANCLFFGGVYALGKKNILGFYLNTFANLLYAIQSTLMENYALFGLSFGLIILNIMGVVEWKCSGERHV